MAKTVKTTRTEIFDEIWNFGLEKTSEKYTVSLNELIEVCKTNNIPMPYKTYFADRASGKELDIPKLSGNANALVELHLVWKRRKKIDSTLSSKANAICILQTLEDYSDANDKFLSVQDIIKYMDENYRITVDRRTIYNTIQLLIDLDYEISIEKRGSKNYYKLTEKTLAPLEVKIILDSLALNPLIPLKTKDEISNKINQYLAKGTPLQRAWSWHSFDNFVDKSYAEDTMYGNLDEIDSAISQGKKIEFNYLKYDTNGNKIPYRKEKFVVTPYRIMLENGMYFLSSSGETDDHLIQTRLDQMTNVCVSEENGNGRQVFGCGKPIGYTYTPEERAQFMATFNCNNELIDKVTTDFLGAIEYLNIADNGDGKTFNFTLFSNAEFITQWALSVVDKCEVIEPQEIRDLIIKRIKNNKYGV